MYAPYVSLVKKLFSKSLLIIDRFHIVQHIGRTFQNQRIKETTQLLKNKEPKIRRLGKQMNRYWRFLQKAKGKLDYLQRH